MEHSEMQQIVHSMITFSDYNRAKFAMLNADTVRVPAGLWRRHSADRIMNCAHWVVVNYEHPDYTFNAMAPYMDEKHVIKLLRASVPTWRRTIDAFHKARDTYAKKVYGISKQK